MNLRILLFIFTISILIGHSLEAQKLKSTDLTNKSELGLRDCGTRNPGTVTFGPVVGQSNDGRPDTIYLCYNDRIFIKNNGDGDFNTGDPDPSTPSAVGYLLYADKPTVNGNSFAAIQADEVLSNPPPPTGQLWYFMGTPNGDITLINDGSVNATHNAGSPFPLWLAPATFDAYTLAGGEYYGQYENGGSCVKVNTGAAFPVVYLNEVEISNFTTTSPSSYSGKFTLSGGFPEYNASASYTVTMELKTNSNVKANLFGGPYFHGQDVSFAAPQMGVYRITVSDGKSCLHTEEVTLPQGNIDIDIESGMVALSDVICLEVTVKNFKNMLGGSFVIGYNPTHLEFDHIEIPTNNPLNLTTGSFVPHPNDGRINFIWFDPLGVAKNLPDDHVLFSICFKAIGPPGTQTEVKLVPPLNATASEFVDNNGVVFNIRNKVGIVIIKDPTQLEVDVSVCSTTGTTGSITFTAFGPDPQYNYTFNLGLPNIVNKGVPFTVSNLSPGTYTLDVFSVAGVHVISMVVVSNAPPVNVLATLTNPGCSDSDDGKISIVTSGGVAPYTIEWSTFEFNKNEIVDLAAANYNVTITDFLGCVFTDSYTLTTVPMGLNPAVIVSPACSGQPSGSISIAANGGNPKPGATYDYKWSYNNITQIGVTTGELTNVPEGDYSVTVTDANGCSINATFTLSPGIVIDATVLSQEPVCYGDGTGNITVTGTTNGSTSGPYTFVWEASAGTPVNTNTTSRVSGLNGGIYTVTITDQAGCMAEKEIDIKGPGEIVFLITSKVDDNCSGAPAGSAVIFDGSGNAVPFPIPNNPNNGFYRFTWSNGSNPTVVDGVSLTLTNLAGSADGIRYYVTITGYDGCEVDTSFLIFKKDAPVIEFDTLVPIACVGGDNGSIQATITAKGSDISTVTWSNNAGLPVNAGDPKSTYTSTISNLSGGDYIVTVNTLSGCQISDTITLLGQGSVDIGTDVIVPTTCPDSDDGTITINATGGVPPYSYLWSNGQTTDVATNLTVGNYTVTITDNSNCPPYVESFTVTSAPSIVSLINPASIVASDCFDAAVGSGSATINASGGNANSYTFTWSSGETNTGTSSTASQLKGGWQYVTISDGTCNVLDSVLIPSPAPITSNNSAVINDVTCFGDNDGTISFTAIGGNGGYSYQWNPAGNNSSNLTGLSAGSYQVTITDSKNCTGTDSFIINEPDLMVASINTGLTKDVKCFGEQSGSIGVNVAGGNGNYTYSWNPALVGNVSSSINLPAGNYLISVTDQKGCSSDVSVTIIEPTQLDVDFDPVPEPQCAGFETTFEINSISGGTGPDYTYRIDGGQTYTTFEIAKVTGGDHILTIIDENGCSKDSSFTVSEPQPILVSLPEDLTINLGDSILLSPTVQSAFPTATITWSPAEYVSCTNCDQTYASVINNQYIIVEVKDVNGCSGLDSILIKVDRTRKIYIPNAFSPNKDGINDFFQIYTGPGVAQVEYVRVFDRYGALLYEQKSLQPSENGTTNGWDGTYRGKYLDPGVFTYVTNIKFVDGKEQLYFGSVTIVR